MTNNQYIAELVAKLRYAPKTLSEALLLKTHILAEFMEQDMALNDLIKQMKDDEVEARIMEQVNKGLDEFFGTEEKEKP